MIKIFVKFAVILVLVLIFAVFSVVSAQTENLLKKDLTEFETFVEEQMLKDKIPGLSIGFIKGDMRWSKGFGYADIENKSKAKSESMYRLASITKPMTATAILQLVEKGKIDLDAEVQTYVPYFPKKKYPVKIRHLLGHLGGISHYKNFDLEGHFKTHKNTREAIRVFENFDLVAEPGTRYRYSSYGYNLLGAVIEGASGQSYSSYMRENIWKPLGMNNTRLDNPTELIPNRVRGYRIINGRVQNSEFVDISSRFAAGGLRSTVDDLLTFGKGTVDGKTLSKSSLDLMYNSMKTRNGAVIYYSAGWRTFPQNGRFVIYHSGAQAETSTFLYVFPSRNVVIAVTANLERANLSPYVKQLFEMLTGEAWNMNLYIANGRSKMPLFSAMKASFEEGRGYFEKTQKAFSDANEIKKAFAEFNRMLNSTTLTDAGNAELTQKVNRERVLADGAFVKIGSFISKKLMERFGKKTLKNYSNVGAITFFDDYISLYKKDKSIAKDYQFNKAVEKTIRLWQESWDKTNTASTRNLVITPAANFNQITLRLKRDFANKNVYLNFSREMVGALQTLAIRGNIKKALKIGKLASELYPDLAPTNAYYGILLTLVGDKENGTRFLQKAVELDPKSIASANGLNRTAFDLRRFKMPDGGIALLLTAIKIHPKQAVLYESLGDFFMEKGLKNKALSFYKKTLEINPNFPKAKKVREAINKLETK